MFHKCHKIMSTASPPTPTSSSIKDKWELVVLFVSLISLCFLNLKPDTVTSSYHSMMSLNTECSLCCFFYSCHMICSNTNSRIQYVYCGYRLFASGWWICCCSEWWSGSISYSCFIKVWSKCKYQCVYHRLCILHGSLVIPTCTSL